MPTYREHPPAPDLAPWVQCFWTIQASAAPPWPNRVLPDGCADVIVDLSRGVDAFAVGPMHTAEVVGIAGRVDMFGVRFRPGAAAVLLGAPLGDMCDLHVPLDALWGGVAAELSDALAGSPAPAPTRDRVRHVERVLRARLAAARPGHDGGDVVARAVALFRRARGGVGVQAVASALGVHERRLERAFAHHVGLSPKFLARVERFRHAVALVDRGAPRPWSAIAYEAGYADQAHLVRECRALAGLTPAALAAERRRVGFVQYDEGGTS